MYSYVKGSVSVQKMLTDFLKHGIDVSKLTSLDKMIESSEIDKVRILNSYLSLAEQRKLFGAMRNINNILKVMKEKIKIARETHQNPTYLELSREIMDHLSNIAPLFDDLLKNGKTREIQRISELSRILYRKAKSLGFYPDIGTQLNDAGITEDEVEAFVTKLKNNIILEMMEDGDELSE